MCGCQISNVPMNKTYLLNSKELAAALGRGVNYPLGMKRAGYRFQYHALKKTTLGHALRALQQAEDFVCGNYLRPGWEKLPKLLATDEHRTAEVAGKSY